VRLAVGHEAFHYPNDTQADLMDGAVVCRH
jgi:hypothetical protein